MFSRADPSCIPQDRLALQAILHFTTAPLEEVTPFLQALALSNGFAIPPEALSTLYAAPKTHFELDYPPSLVSNRPPAALCVESPLQEPDLRRTLAQLQFWCGSASALPAFLSGQREPAIKEEKWPKAEDGWGRACQLAEAMSASDLVDRTSGVHLQVCCRALSFSHAELV
jgi:hypothetical protein